jgi:hypothetical protein
MYETPVFEVQKTHTNPRGENALFIRVFAAFAGAELRQREQSI